MYVGIFLGSVLIASVSQILLKKCAMKTYHYRFGDYLNPLVISAYGLLFISMMLTIYAYRGVPLKDGPVMESASYIFVALLSSLFLKEKISSKKRIGLLLIVAGIIISNI